MNRVNENLEKVLKGVADVIDVEPSIQGPLISFIFLFIYLVFGKTLVEV